MFAARLKQFRESRNLTLAQLAERAGISKTYLWELENDEAKSPSARVLIELASVLSINIGQLMGCESTWPTIGGTIRDMRRPITEEWLIANGFRIEDGRNDERLPVRTLAIGDHSSFRSPDDLCIDVAPTNSNQDEWHIWIARREPYRFLHVRHMKETWELVRLYEGLTGRVWPGEF